MFSIPSAFGLSILANQLLSILTTSEFSQIGQTIVPFVSSGVVLFGIYMLFAEVIKLSKRTKIFLVVFFIASLLNLGLNFIFVPYFGIIGAAITTLISYGLVVFVIGYKSRQILKFNIGIIFIIKSIFSSAVMTLVISFIDPTSRIEVILSLVVGIIVYFCMLYILRGFSKNELKTIMGIIGLEQLYYKLGRKQN
jgi:O-antigen/teichoic acid export membrane protein